MMCSYLIASIVLFILSGFIERGIAVLFFKKLYLFDFIGQFKRLWQMRATCIFFYKRSTAEP